MRRGISVHVQAEKTPVLYPALPRVLSRIDGRRVDTDPDDGVLVDVARVPDDVRAVGRDAVLLLRQVVRIYTVLRDSRVHLPALRLRTDQPRDDGTALGHKPPARHVQQFRYRLFRYRQDHRIRRYAVPYLLPDVVLAAVCGVRAADKAIRYSRSSSRDL